MKRSAIGRGLALSGIILMVINRIVFVEMNDWVQAASIGLMLTGIILLVPAVREKWKQKSKKN